MVKQRVIPPYDDRPEEETFEDVMDALGVEVVKQKPELKNIRWLSPVTGNLAALRNKISINKNSISIGKEVAEMLHDSTNKKLQFAAAEYKGKPVLVIKNSRTGYKISENNKGNSYKAGSIALIKIILENGLPLGVYKVQKAKGGVICIPEEGQT